MDKLIIHHGERVTEHEIGEVPLVVGRDPECDLFFADKKLSRRHARFERSDAGVRLVDLGSRNGSWVNEERIDERELAPGDEVRLGGLHIQFESLRAVPELAGPSEIDDGAPALTTSAEGNEGNESTIYLGGDEALPETGTVVFRESPVEDESGSQTVVLSGGAEPPPAPTPPTPDDTSTVFLKADAVPEPQPEPPNEPVEMDEPDEIDETLQRPESERTVVLSAQGSQASYDTGAVVYKGEVDPAIREAATRLDARAPETESESTEEEPLLELEEDLEAPLSASVTFVPELPSGGRSWAAKLTWLVMGLALFASLVLTVPVIRILGAATAEQSAARGRALLSLLAVSNETALGEGRSEQASIERVAAESGVMEAFVLDPRGKILAPRSRVGETLTVEGLPSVGDVRSLREGVGADGERVLAQPVSQRGRRLGVVVLRLAAPGTGSAATALLFGFLLLAVAVAVTVLLARRMTIGPLQDLRLEVDALGDARPGALAVNRPYRELSLLAASLNRLLAARPVGSPPPEED